MDLMSSIGAGGLSFVRDMVDSAVQYFNQKKLNRQAQNDTQQNMKLQKQLNLEQQFDSLKSYTSALRAAGLNPALASSSPLMAQGVSSAAGNAGQAAMPQNTTAETMQAFNAVRKADSEIANVEANTELQKEETREKKIKNDREVTKDSLVSKSALDALAAMREETDSPFIRGFIEEFENGLSAKDMNLGLLDSFQKVFYDLSQKERDRELDFLVKEFDKSVYQKQFENGSAEALADMPRALRFQVYRNCALMLAQLGQLNAETSLTEDKRNLIRSNVAKLGQEVQSLLHHDPAAMWHSGDISGLLAMLGYDGIKAAANGAGFGVGAALGSRVGGSAVGAYATKATTPISSMTRDQVHRQLELSRNEIKALKQAAKSAASNKRLGELYQEQKALMDRLRNLTSKDYAR